MAKYIQYDVTTGEIKACNHFAAHPADLPANTGQAAVDDLFESHDYRPAADSVLITGMRCPCCDRHRPICITPTHIVIGCQAHTTDEWDAFPDDRIAGMHGDALAWWHINKPWIMTLARQVRAAPISA
jgi:hypothetical protein